MNAELAAWAAIAAGVTLFFAPPPLAAALALAVGIAFAAFNPRLPIVGRATAAAVAVAAWPIFFLLRTNVLNQDGNMLTPKLQHDVPLVGAHLSHDELLELFVHSRIWDYTHRWWGWSVVFSYQVVSCTAGVLFLYALLRLASRLAPERTWLFLGGVLSGGYMQLFFGDVENYTVTAAIVVVYLVAACRFLAGEMPLWVPAMVLAGAATFHLETAWLLPSAIYLAMVSRSRTGDIREAVRSAAFAVALIAVVFVYFQFNGLPLVKFFSGHAGHALRAEGFATALPSNYYNDQLRLLLVLCPAAAMLVPLILSFRRRNDEVTAFLVVAAVSMLIFQAVWKAQLGVFDDWNLYAIGALVIAICVWRYVAAAATTVPMRLAAAALVAIGSLHTYSWILANHRGTQ